MQTKNNGWQRFYNHLIKNEKKTLLTLVSILILVGLFSGAVAVAHPKIRRSQLDSLVNQEITSDHMLPLEYGSESQKIQQTKAISVMFAKPYGKSFEHVEELLKKEEAYLNRTFYYYPLVYNSEQTAKKYQLDPDKVTFIFFQKGQEKKRFVVEDLDTLDKTFVPELNRLPMWRLKEGKTK